jgi:hypothetical protein
VISRGIEHGTGTAFTGVTERCETQSVANVIIKEACSMSQVNVNPGGPVHDDTGDRTAAAGINFATMLIVLAIVVAVLWFLFSGPIGGLFRGGSTNVDVNVRTPSNPPAQTAPSGPSTTNPGSTNPGSSTAPSNPASKP